jgi:hypothetical protein
MEQPNCLPWVAQVVLECSFHKSSSGPKESVLEILGIISFFRVYFWSISVIILVLRIIATFIREPTIKVSPGSKSFRSVRAGLDKKARFTVKNKTTKGKQPLNIGQISILSRVFAIIAESDGCSNTSLGPGGSCRFEIQYRPILQGTDITTIEIPSNDPDSPLTIISVSGEGI